MREVLCCRLVFCSYGNPTKSFHRKKTVEYFENFQQDFFKFQTGRERCYMSLYIYLNVK